MKELNNRKKLNLNYTELNELMREWEREKKKGDPLWPCVVKGKQRKWRLNDYLEFLLMRKKKDVRLNDLILNTKKILIREREKKDVNTISLRVTAPFCNLRLVQETSLGLVILITLLWTEYGIKNNTSWTLFTLIGYSYNIHWHILIWMNWL